MNDFVQRLRTRYKLRCRRCNRFNVDMEDLHALLDQAADEIERLRAENAKLRAAATELNASELLITLPAGDGFAKTERFAEAVKAAIAIELDAITRRLEELDEDTDR